MTHLFASEFRRTRETLEPLAKASGIQIEVLRAAKTADAIAKLDSLPATSVGVLAGHSNTVPVLFSALGIESAGLEKTQSGPALSEKDFGRIFVLTFAPPDASGARSEVQLLELAYGG